MKNPLFKRLPREFRQDLGKYIALFLFLCLAIGFCSGFLVADGSLKRAYDDSFEKYNIEDGHFALAVEAGGEILSEIEKEGVSVYPLFYKDKEIAGESTLRIYQNRVEVNRADVMEGALPEKNNEIAIDRLYAENNGIAVGDVLPVGDTEFTVCGFIALSDYSALFKNNTDMMFDAKQFSIALVTEEAFDALDNGGLHYCYAWINQDQSLSDAEKQDHAEALMKAIAKTAVLTDFVPRENNQAIMFTGDDMGGDKVMIQWMLYIVMVVLAFIFAVTTRNTIEQEASVIGTLRASGYTKRELMSHYLALPLLVTVIAAILGNIMGYTFLKELMVSLYYHSYSLPTYVTVWNAEAFILTTVIPCIIILAVNLLVLRSALSVSPLNFLRRELKKRKKKKVAGLPEWKFLARFRMRIILQNLPTYFTMFVGILLVSILLMFGLMFTPLLSQFKEEVVNSKIADYQYILKMQAETEIENAEKYAVTALESETDEEITVYGIAEDSAYLSALTFPAGDDQAILSDGYMEKFGLSIGDTVTLHQKYEEGTYTFTIAGSYHYPATLCIFIPISRFNTVFGHEDGYFSGYFSNEKLTDIDEMLISSIITQHDLAVVADQLEDSMGAVFPIFGGFAVMLYILIIYLLAKLIVEKNSRSISMVKILGYTDREASNLYNMATTIVVIISLCISLPVCLFSIRGIYYVMMQEFSGWLTFYIAPWIYPVMLAIGGICYFVVYLIQAGKIRKISMSQALKHME